MNLARSEYILVMSMLHSARHDCAWKESYDGIADAVDIAMTKLEAVGGDYISECHNDEHWARMRELWDEHRRIRAA